MKVVSRRKRRTSAAAVAMPRAVRTRQGEQRAAAKRRKTLRGILRILRAHLPEFVERYHVKSLGVFGSYVRDDATDRSDLDVLVEFEKGARLSLYDFVGLENELSDLLGLKVDLIQEKTLRSPILENILKEVIRI